MHENIEAVGLPKWTEADVDAGEGAPARAEGAGDRARDRAPRAARPRGRCPTTRSAAAAPTTSATSRGTCRRCRCSFPANIPGRPGPQLGQRDRDGDADRAQGRDRRRQGAGDDDARHPDCGRSSSTQAWDYFTNVQTKDRKYTPLHPPDGQAGDLAEQGDRWRSTGRR